MAPYHVPIINSKNDKADSLNPATPKAPLTPSNVAPGSLQFALKPPRKRPMAVAPRLQPDEATADFAIVCDSGTIRAHKSVLIAACPYFERLFRFDGKEVTDVSVFIPGISHRTMRCALHFMYSGAYSLADGEIVPSNSYCNHVKASFSADSPAFARIFKLKCPTAGRRLSPFHLLPHINVYGLADYLDMPKLKMFARCQAYYVLHVYWKDPNVAFKDALDLAFANTPDHDLGIRRLLIDTLDAHPGLWVDNCDVGDWLDEHPGVLDEVDNGRDLPRYELTAPTFGR